MSRKLTHQREKATPARINEYQPIEFLDSATVKKQVARINNVLSGTPMTKAEIVAKAGWDGRINFFDVIGLCEFEAVGYRHYVRRNFKFITQKGYGNLATAREMV